MDISQRSFPSQFQEESQQLHLNQKVYKSIKVKVDFNNEAAVIGEESKQEGAVEAAQQAGGYGLSHLSGG